MTKMEDGYQTSIAFSSAGSGVNVYMYNTGVTPPGLAGGGPIDTTTMENVTYRTQVPKSLIGMSPCSFVGGYNSNVYTELLLALNVNQEIVVTFPDTSTLTFWGWIDEFVPNPLVEGEMPTANITIIPSCWNGSAEIAPAIG